MDYYGAVEAGGTKFVCSIASDPDHYYEEIRFPTTNPEETIGKTIDFFKEQKKKYAIKSIGVASFGPIDLNPKSPTYGYITSTPKPGWKDTDLIGPLEKDEELENNNSLVLLAEGGGGSMLLTGDMEFPEESSLLNAGAIPRADVLKIGNHGEGDATSNAFVNAVQPSLAVISTNSDDEPDTPSPRVLRLLASWDIPVSSSRL